MDQSHIVNVLGAAPPARAAGTAVGNAGHRAGWWKPGVFPNTLTRVQIGVTVAAAAATLALFAFMLKPDLPAKCAATTVEKIVDPRYYAWLLLLCQIVRVGAGTAADAGATAALLAGREPSPVFYFLDSAAEAPSMFIVIYLSEVISRTLFITVTGCLSMVVFIFHAILTSVFILALLAIFV